MKFAKIGEKIRLEMFHDLLKILDWSEVFCFVFGDDLKGRFLVGGIFVFDFPLKGSDLTLFLFVHQRLEMFRNEAPTLFKELGVERRKFFLHENR